MGVVDVDVETIVRENLDKTVHMSLATVHGDAPWVCEVHFAYDSQLNLYFRSLATRRHSQEIAGNAKVAGSIIDKYELDGSDPVLGIYFEGNARLLGPGDEQDQAAQCLIDRLHTTSDIISEAAQADGHQFYKITVANWYVFGRFGDQPSQKYKLAWH
jgi:uncharacterized protein YhbP (UPF0306 family)